MRTPEQVLDDLISDMGDSGISFEDPYPKMEGNENEYRTRLQMDIELTKKEFYEACIKYAERPDKRFGYWQRKYLESREKRLWRLSGKIKVFKGLKEDISTEKIIEARDYPLIELIKNRAGMANCPFHEDKRASMDIRKNFYYCYGCNATGDVIDYVMKNEGLTFIQAVERLT